MRSDSESAFLPYRTMQVFRMRTGSQNRFPATIKSEENTQTNTAARAEAHDRPVGICPSVHLTRRAWSLSLVQCRLSWSHSVIFPFHGPPFPRHPERYVNPCRFWWSQVRAISPTQNASFSMKVSGEPYFHILCVKHSSAPLWNAAASLSLSLPADEGMSGSRFNPVLTEHAQIHHPPASFLTQRDSCPVSLLLCVCEGLRGSRQLVL